MRTPIIALRNSRKDRGQHSGLLLQRYLCEAATGKEGNPGERREILQAAINAAANADVQSLYQKAYGRWNASLPKAPPPVDLATQERLIVGLGSENVLETGIRLHHTYGMPIIPGSALKGLAAHYCDQVWGERGNPRPSDESLRFRSDREADRKNNRAAEPQGDFHRLLFGNTDDSGCIVFHDAWYVPDSETEPLKLDVMTPHHPDYNRDPSDPKFCAPTDFDNPTPIPFLSVKGNFHIAVSWHGPEHDESQKWAELALSLLRDTLFEWGVGGKTSSGYGRLVAPTQATRSASNSDGARQATELQKPRYERGDSIQVTREKVNDKIKFRADDGYIGHFVPPESPPEGDALTVWVGNVSSHGYTFTMKQPGTKAKPSKQDGRGKRR